jgi:hypothetical protein
LRSTAVSVWIYCCQHLFAENLTSTSLFRMPLLTRLYGFNIEMSAIFVWDFSQRHLWLLNTIAFVHFDRFILIVRAFVFAPQDIF